MDYTELLEEINQEKENLNKTDLDMVMERLDNIEKAILHIQETAPTKESIRDIKDTTRRLKAIEENIHLFKGMTVGGKVIE